MLITEVLVRTAPFSTNSWLDGQRISTPMGWFPEYAASRAGWRGPGADLVWVLIRTDAPEVFGIGQARGGAVAAALIEHHLSRILVGHDATHVVERTAQMQRAVAPYAAGGLAAMGVGACELALWDLSARGLGVPLVTMLGGTPTPLRYYVTVSHPNQVGDLDPALLAGAAVLKAPMPFGPADGSHGMRENLRVLDVMRERVPEDLGLAVDCFMSWSVPYAAEFARRAAEHGLAWIEEPLPPEDLEGYAELRTRAPAVSIAAGEHTFGLADGIRFVSQRTADIVQLDVTWCGGLEVAQTVGRLALQHGLTFAPHASAMQPWAVHLLAALGPGALAEVLIGVGGAAAVPEPGREPGVGITPADAGFA